MAIMYLNVIRLTFSIACYPFISVFYRFQVGFYDEIFIANQYRSFLIDGFISLIKSAESYL